MLVLVHATYIDFTNWLKQLAVEAKTNWTHWLAKVQTNRRVRYVTGWLTTRCEGQANFLKVCFGVRNM
jgi:hypothetical protein